MAIYFFKAGMCFRVQVCVRVARLHIPALALELDVSHHLWVGHKVHTYAYY